jgi:uncharacterized protein (TIGR02270 family)
LIAVRRVLEQHVDKAAALWLLRDEATDQPQYDLRHLAKLDDQIDAHIDGLQLAGGEGLRLAWANLEKLQGRGELFVVAVLALAGRNEDLIERAIASAEAMPEIGRGLSGALGWVGPTSLRGLVARWLDSSSPFRRRLGVIACSHHRADPGARMADILGDEPGVRARALRLAGEIGRLDVRAAIGSGLDDENPKSRFWAAWAIGLLGDRRAAIAHLKPFASVKSSFQRRALDLAIRLEGHAESVGWLRMLATEPDNARSVVVSAGVLGDPVAVAWLIDKMRMPELARIAGEAFTTITGTDLLEHDLDGEAPDGFALADPADERTDTDLPWPNPDTVLAWWTREGTRFKPGIRYLRGVPLNQEACADALRRGSQRDRRAAAHELTLLNPGRRLWNWRAKSSLQQNWLSELALNSSRRRERA